MNKINPEESFTGAILLNDDECVAERLYEVETYKGKLKLTNLQIMQIADVYSRMEYLSDMRLSYKEDCDLCDSDIIDIYDDYVRIVEDDNVTPRIPLEKAINKWLEENEREERVPNPIYKNKTL